MMALFEIFSWLVTMIFIVILFGLLAYVAIVALMVVGKIIWAVIKEPLSELYFDHLDRKAEREKTKYSRKRKKKEWYDDYSKFR